MWAGKSRNKGSRRKRIRETCKFYRRQGGNNVGVALVVERVLHGVRCILPAKFDNLSFPAMDMWDEFYAVSVLKTSSLEKHSAKERAWSTQMTDLACSDPSISPRTPLGDQEAEGMGSA